MAYFRPIDNGERWWPAPDTRAEALDEAKYYMYMNTPLVAWATIVALCLSVNKKGTDSYNETLEQAYKTPYQRTKKKDE